MAKVVMVVPTRQMLSDALSLLPTAQVDAEVYVENSATVLQRVKQAQAGGALVAIARGNHANLILTQLHMPLVEIRLTGQSIAELITQAAALVNKPKPRVAFVGFRNMFSDIAAFEPILQVTTLEYLVDKSQDIPAKVLEAKQAGADVLIGGEIALAAAGELGLPGVFLRSSKDSLLTALRSAKRLLYAIELERKNTLEVTALLNYSFDGIIKLDGQGNIAMVNYMVERLFHRPGAELLGQPITQFFDEQDGRAIMECLRTRKKQQSLMLHRGNVSLIANLAVLADNGDIEGAILSFQEFGTIEAMEETIRQDRYSRVQKALGQFGDLVVDAPAYAAAVSAARRYAQYELPILLTGEVGAGKRTLAECIHNASMRRNNPFVTLDCAAMPPLLQEELLGGDERASLLKGAHTGTLFIDNIDRLTQNAQYQLLSALRDGLIWQIDRVKALPVNIRLVAASSRRLYPLTASGAFNLSLYAMLSQLEIAVPALRERPEDIQQMLDYYVARYCTKYRKHLVLSQDARQVIAAYAWPGNLLQLNLFAEKLTLLADEQLVTGAFALSVLPRSFDQPDAGEAQAAPHPRIVYSDPEAERILSALEQHGGNRGLAAQALGISKTTLWRKMSRFGIESSFKV